MLGEGGEEMDPRERVDEIGEIVIDRALHIFLECGAEEDFYIQSISPSSVIFGGMNRVIWRPEEGFRMDEEYCTPKFIERFKTKF
jgi:hypothetical protein